MVENFFSFCILYLMQFRFAVLPVTGVSHNFEIGSRDPKPRPFELKR